MAAPPIVVAATTPAAAAAAVNAASAASTIVHGKYIAGAALAVGLIAILLSLRRQNRIANGYALTDLLLGDDGKASKAAHVMFGSFFLTSWVVVYAALMGKLSDLMFGAYLAAWVTPAVTKLIMGSPRTTST